MHFSKTLICDLYCSQPYNLPCNGIVNDIDFVVTSSFLCNNPIQMSPHLMVTEKLLFHVCSVAFFVCIQIVRHFVTDRQSQTFDFIYHSTGKNVFIHNFLDPIFKQVGETLQIDCIVTSPNYTVTLEVNDRDVCIINISVIMLLLCV